MKNFKSILPVVFFILFELAFGILLLMSPTQLTRTILLCFGLVLLILGVIYLVRYLKEKKLPEKTNYLTLPFAVLSLAAGIFCVIYGLLANAPETFAAIIYGAIFIVLGIYKIKTYNDNKKEGIGASVLSLISGLVSAAFGVVVIFLKTGDNTKLLLTLAGIAIIALAAVDIVAVAATLADKSEKKEGGEESSSEDQSENS